MPQPNLTLLHTAEVQADAFAERLARRGVEAQHDVRPDLLSRAMSGGIDEALGSEIDDWLMAARRTSDAVLCTCSTLGPRVDARADARLLRIDRPLMRIAAELQEPMLLTYCLASTAGASRALLNEERERAGHLSSVTELHIEAAWAEFEAGDMTAYHRQIAARINDQITESERAPTVILAQASMADAAALIQSERVYSAPELALDALLRASGDPELADTIDEIAEGLWVVTGPELVFAGAPMHTRMTVVRLDDGRLWVHSPIQWGEEVAKFMASLGSDVAAIVAPNKFHHLFVEAWRSKYPNARVFAEPQAMAKIAELSTAEALSDDTPELYAQELDQVIVDGNRMFQEAAFFHRASRTLILTDLFINLRPDNIPWLPRLFLKLEGVLAPNGGVPRLYKFLFQNKAKTRRAVDVIRSWAPERVLFCHGEAFDVDAQTLIEREFAFLN